MSRAFAPASLAEALDIMADEKLRPLPIAGCTDFMVGWTARRGVEPNVVSLLRVAELKGFDESEQWLDIGAATTFFELRKHPSVRAKFPALAHAAATIGAWQIQNRATLGGNIANASPAGDSLPVLLALGAELSIAGRDGERALPYCAFHLGYRKTALRPGELIVRVRLPIPNADSVQFFRKVGTREAQAISKVVVALAAVRIKGALHGVRIGAGSVAPTPTRLLGAEQACEGRYPGFDVADRVERFARQEVQPIDDVRSTAEYRSFVLGRILRRMVLQAG